MDIEYIGEHLLPGQIGNFLIVLSFVAAILSTVSFYLSSRIPTDTGWKRIARMSFRIHTLSVMGIIGTLFYILVSHFFEYHYVWQHSNTEMPMRYILSCFWEGQEGSFLLWIFWQAILGNILIRSAKNWETSVMTVFSSVQVFLASMLLGISIFGYKIGINPFILLREHPDMINMPFTMIADYVDKIDGRGLNPILQSYWMIIHPPTLFLGFSATLIPFSYAIAGLWKKRYDEWQKPALPWAFFGVMILGTGVLMGGAWAYEALSFGGFWAWDPVENASLVPWITLVAAAHVMMINSKNGQSIKTTFFLTTITFILILYSTFLTRSGILGDTSVHAFTDLGMSGQLLIYLLFFAVLSIVLLAVNWRQISTKDQEESIRSREFWMFIGALVLFISSFQIIFSTSIPVINVIFGTNLAPPVDAIEHYNSWQIPFAIIIALLIAIGQFLKYKKTEMKKFINTMLLSFVGSLVLSVFIAWGLDMFNFYYFLLLFTSIFAIAANFDYLIRIMGGNIKKGGASIAHIGFGMILLGALISTSKSNIISQNTSGVDIEKLGEGFLNNEDIMLLKNDTLRMDEYYVSYRGKNKVGVNIYYEIEYLKKDEDGTYTKEFTLYPVVQMNDKMGNVAEPDTRHYFTKDIYTHITYADLEHIDETDDGGYSKPKNHTISVGDTIFTSNNFVILKRLNTNVERTQYELSGDDIAVGAQLKIVNLMGDTSFTEPIYIISAKGGSTSGGKNMYVTTIDDSIPELGLKFSFWKISPETGKIDILVSEKKSNKKEFIIMKAIVFPYINILWTGAILLVIGTLLAIRQRVVNLK